jgi:hypothetical protein
MGIQNLLDQAEEERQLCKTFGTDPFKSKRYRSIQRQILIKHEDSIPTVRITKRVAVAVLVVALPSTFLTWAWIISEIIAILCV